MAKPNREKVNELTEAELIEIANHRAGKRTYSPWQRGSIYQAVNIAGVLLEVGDAVLFGPGVGRAVRVWSPLVTSTDAFILPASHVVVGQVPAVVKE